MPSSSTPVASGSRVPEWPIRFVPSWRRAFATTSCEVKPAGLSTPAKPHSSPLAVVILVGSRLVVNVVLGEQLLDARPVGDHRVDLEPQLGRALQASLPGDRRL